MNQTGTSWRKLLNEAEQKLSCAGIADAKTDAWLILSGVFSLSRAAYLAGRDETLNPDPSLTALFRKYLDLRAERIPLQQLFGRAWFYGLPFEVNPDVLIPRPDTERLVEAVLEKVPEGKGMRLLDVCTGSGCIAIALVRAAGFSAEGVDISPEAVETARRNAALNRVEAAFYVSDLFEKTTGLYDIVVSNPPYISKDVIESLDPEVRDHEPRLALDGGADGLDFYRRLVPGAGKVLKPGGRLFLEIGYDQGEAVTGLMRENGYQELMLLQDYAGLDRVVSGVSPKRREEHV